MARKLRLEFPGACYHVINRGNDRRDVFETQGASLAFMATLQETARRFGWRVYAYGVMSNHYHLALETPEPTLVEGMHWLQSTFATRFNRFRKESGHLFQGRYQALVLEDGSVLGRVVRYIHLNPVRAKILAPEQLESYPFSSLSRLHEPGSWVLRQPWLMAIGGWEDDEPGHRAYLAHVREVAAQEERWEEMGLTGLSSGWAIGTAGWRRALAKEHAALALSPGLGRSETVQLRQALWAQALEDALAKQGRTSADLETRPRRQPWNVDLAIKLRTEHAASVTWLADALKLGKPESVRGYLCRARCHSNSQDTP